MDALRHAWGDGLKKRLLQVPDSSAVPLPYSGESCTLDLPAHPGSDFYFGKPGKEKPLTPISPLDQEEWQLLMLLGWHVRNFTILETTGIRLLGNGWIDAHDILPLAKKLQERIQPILPDLVEIRDDRYTSLRISPDILFSKIDWFR